MQESIFNIVGGLAIFLFGIHLLSDGLKKSASLGVKNFLKKVTGSPLSATLIGVAVTAIIQSSSATTVLTVGFVNAGMMTLKQAIGVIFGANIGTTVTAQLMAFKMSHFALPIMAVGMFIYLYSPKDNFKNIGAFLVGFGFIFFGMDMMAGGVKPLRSSPEVIGIFHSFSTNPFLGVLAGMIMTMIIQSSSATVGIVLTLVGTGMVDLNGAIPLILGDNIGTCITAALAAIGTNLAARRTAAAHFGFNIIGTLIVLILLPLYVKLVLLTSADPVRQAANAHMLFNVMNTIIFLPFTGLYAKLIERIIPGKTEVKEDRAVFLAKNLLTSPAVAFDAINREIVRSLGFCKENLDIIGNCARTQSTDSLGILKEHEQILDNVQADVTSFLVELSRQELNERDSVRIPLLLHTINDLERMGDLGESLNKVLMKKKKLGIDFDKEAQEDMLAMLDTLTTYTSSVISLITEEDPLIFKKTIAFEKEINKMKKSFQKKSLRHSQKDDSQSVGGMLYYDVLVNFERIGDLLTNITEAYETLFSKEPVLPVS